MSEFLPVVSLVDMSMQDPEDVGYGYSFGFAGAPEPLSSGFSRAFLHGWKNGAVAGGFREMDADQLSLAHSYSLAQGCSAAASGVRADWIAFSLPLQ